MTNVFEQNQLCARQRRRESARVQRRFDKSVLI
jgi:hypothetical protein